MENIKEFEILLDVSDRDVLYDYGHEEFIYKPKEGKWDPTTLRSHLSQDDLDPEDENRLQRSKRMDEAMSDFRFREKDYKKKSAKGKEKEDKYKSEEGEEIFFSGLDELQPSQELPFRVLPLYKPGELVRGKVILDLSGPLEAEEVFILFKGQAACRIRVYHNKGYYDDRNTEKYVYEKTTAWTKTKEGSIEDQMQLLSVDRVATSPVLSSGRHEFPFTFLIPADAIQSTVPMVDSSCDYAHVTYKVKAVIEQGKKFGKGNIAACRGIWVNKSFDIATMGNDALNPISVTESINTGIFGKSGEVNISANLPRKAFVRTEKIPVQIQVENLTGSPIEHIYVRLVLHGKCRTSRSKMRPSRSISIKSNKDFVGPIGPKETANYTLTVPFDFRETILNSDLLPGGTMNDCELIDVDYELQVYAKRKGLRRDLEVKVPLVLGTENSKEDLYGF